MGSHLATNLIYRISNHSHQMQPSPAPATPTTTTLSVVHVPLPLGLGEIAISSVRLTPANATGTVHFTDSATTLGGPIPVGGIAVGHVTVLGKGKNQLTAVFTPSPATRFAPQLQHPCAWFELSGWLGVEWGSQNYCGSHVLQNQLRTRVPPSPWSSGPRRPYGGGPSVNRQLTELCPVRQTDALGLP